MTRKQLECVTRKQHAERHPEGSPQWLVDHLEAIRPLATEWHRSEEGRDWHREHGRAVWDNLPLTLYRCLYCHQPFETKAKRSNIRFCSTPCGQRWRMQHGPYGIDKQCAMCGAGFRTCKFQPARCCGKKCGAQLRIREGTAYRGGRPK